MRFGTGYAVCNLKLGKYRVDLESHWRALGHRLDVVPKVHKSFLQANHDFTTLRVVLSSGGAGYRQGPRPYTIFVRALPRALPLGQEAKKVKSAWSIVLLS